MSIYHYIVHTCNCTHTESVIKRPPFLAEKGDGGRGGGEGGFPLPPLHERPGQCGAAAGEAPKHICTLATSPFQVHFEESHSREDPAIVRSLKDLFGKAKSAIQSNDDVVVPQQKLRVAPERTDIDPVSGVRKLEFPSSTNDAPGRSHFQEFKKIRGARVDRYATETNRLVVRLDKLLRDMPAEPAKRREHERGVVAWIDEDLVKLCPSCARSFNPVRRKHHCRLCGSVMCQDCSQWVDWDLCR